ncbi:MAG TPA: alpha/beta hydrolase [Candidatus Udaeobacter sp.]|nr:alpha/beta hydrolase [Candidatus Udaeobacter sp.]
METLTDNCDLATTGPELSIGTRRIRVNDVDLNVVIQGEGSPVLLVHGFPDDHTVWRNQIPALVNGGFRVIAVDTRGCGESEIKPRVSDYAIDKLVADLVGLVDALGIEKVRVVGHDWGALQAWFFAMQHPERMERCIALSLGHPSAYLSAGVTQKMKGYYLFFIQLRGFIEFLVRQFNWLLFRVVIHYPVEFPNIRERLSRPGRLTAGFNYYRANLHLMRSRLFGHVEVPVVGIWSDGDRFLTENQVRDSACYCDAGFRYFRITGANHWPQLTAPAKLNSLLLKVLQ